MTQNSTLYYVHDPMCSWCWGFRPAWMTIVDSLPGSIAVRYVLGGLAPDSDAPMPADMQMRIRATWQRIQDEIPDTLFNYRFWDTCQPRRSTYPSCRAVLAARQQHSAAESRMLFAIQEAYYLQARNPSDNQVLCELADELDLDPARFRADLDSPRTQLLLSKEFELRDILGAHSFPSLVLGADKLFQTIAIDYNDPGRVMHRILQAAGVAGD